jgi:hypothetical protein
MSVDYQKYSLDELYDVEANIDRIKYPERYELVCKSIIEKKNASLKPLVEDINVDVKKAELENEQYIEKNNAPFFLFIRLILLVSFCSFVFFNDFANYEKILLILIYFAVVTLIKNLFVQYDLFKSNRLKNNIKKFGIRRK